MARWFAVVAAALLAPRGTSVGPTSPYSFSLTTFSPEGRLEQIEFAFKAVDGAPPCAGVVVEGLGAVLAKSARRGARGADAAASPHVRRVTERVVATYAGLPADFRALVRTLQTLAVDHARAWGADATARDLADELAAHVQEHTQLGGLRPYGCAVLLADAEGLWRVDPSGWCARWTATAAGRGAAPLGDAGGDADAGGGGATPTTPDAPVTVVCVKWGAKYDAAYANKLARGVRRHLPAVAAVVCYTDDAAGLDAAVVEARPLPEATPLKTWWLKAYLFADAAGLAGRALYVDLDTVFCGPLASLAAAGPADGLALLATDGLANERRSGGYNSSIMQWTAPAHAAVYDLLSDPASFAAVANCVYKFDHWLEMLFPDGAAARVQDRAPRSVVEYAADVAPNGGEPPRDASVVCFPLEPKPHAVDTPWLKAHWV